MIFIPDCLFSYIWLLINMLCQHHLYVGVICTRLDFVPFAHGSVVVELAAIQFWLAFTDTHNICMHFVVIYFFATVTHGSGF